VVFGENPTFGVLCLFALPVKNWFLIRGARARMSSGVRVTSG